MNGCYHLTFAIPKRVCIAHWEPVANLNLSLVKVQAAELLVHHTFAVDVVAFLPVNAAAFVKMDALLAAEEKGVNTD